MYQLRSNWYGSSRISRPRSLTWPRKAAGTGTDMITALVNDCWVLATGIRRS